MRIFSIIVSALIVILVVTFTVLNSSFFITLPETPVNPFEVKEIPVNLLFFEKPLQVNFAVAIVIAFSLGALLGVMAASLALLKLKRTNKQLEKKILKVTPSLDLKSTLSPGDREAR